ncbi:pentapeptide repeat-containing protein [Nocardia sp. SC052]|uniref:pentapeptide repeat-containing protein n=1 Tax=Nocardia sichangensis TaxID=3385975 RepID=UPI0039A12A9D
MGADLRHADLTAADLSDAILIGVVYDDAALAGTDTRPRSGDENPGQASHHSSGPGPRDHACRRTSDQIALGFYRRRLGGS